MLLLVSACVSSSTKQSDETVKATGASKNKKLMNVKKGTVQIKTPHSWQQVTVKYLALEGGFYGLLSDKGAKLLPMNLPKKYQVAGTILSIKGQILSDVMTIQQWGTPFNISEIKLIKLGNGDLPNY